MQIKSSTTAASATSHSEDDEITTTIASNPTSNENQDENNLSVLTESLLKLNSNLNVQASSTSDLASHSSSSSSSSFSSNGNSSNNHSSCCLAQDELNECAFNRWYEKFEKISIPSKYIRIPDDVLKYLRDEIIVLPLECSNFNDTMTTKLTTTSGKNVSIINTNYNRTDSSSDDDDDDDDDDNLPIPEFPEFSNQIKDIINEFSDSVFIKSNWHCPKDAFWITFGQTLKINDITGVYQLLKASSIIKNDLSYCDTEHYLIVKKWLEINSGTEYRCFVKNRNLIAISPRDWPQYHAHILQQKLDIVRDIISMFKEQIKYRFPLNDFVFDVVRISKDQVHLLDFSPFNSKFTESLAFTWTELEEFETIGDDPEFRYLSSDCGIQPNKRNNYGVPQDIIDLFNGTSSLSVDDSLQNLTDILVRRAQDEHSTAT